LLKDLEKTLKLDSQAFDSGMLPSLIVASSEIPNLYNSLSDDNKIIAAVTLNKLYKAM
jgi:hypothetical protein